MSVRLYPETDITGLAAILKVSKATVEKAYRYRELETQVADHLLAMTPVQPHIENDNLACEVNNYIKEKFPEVFRTREFLQFGWCPVDPHICRGACGEVSMPAEISKILRAHGLGGLVEAGITKLYWC